MISENGHQFKRELYPQLIILTCFMTCDDLLEVIEVVIIVTRCTQNFKGQISNYGRSSMIKEQKFPLETVTRGELISVGVH